MLIRRPSGDAHYVARDASPPLGALPFVRFEDTHAEIEPGSLLLLFTDGLVEVRGTSIELRLEELQYGSGIAGLRLVEEPPTPLAPVRAIAPSREVNP